jgi:CRP/FNR family transcriptional regulator, cyclic AMP receptor protein
MPTIFTIIGYIASGLVLTTFWTNDLRRLRILAILSNIVFISYGALVWLPPVLGLHLLLLPLNAVRLMRMDKCTTPRTCDRRQNSPSHETQTA